MKERLLNLAIGVLTLTSLASVGLLAKRELSPKQQTHIAFVKDKNWRRYANGGISWGSDISPVTLTLFSDFQCPYCKDLDPTVSALKRKYRGSLRVVFHHYPLSAIHPNARDAALAAECANSQGMFAAMDSVLFLHQERLGATSWGWFASQAGIRDTAWLNRCVRDSVFIQRITSDKELAELIPIEGTPTIFVNELRVGGTLRHSVLDSLIAKALGKGN